MQKLHGTDRLTRRGKWKRKAKAAWARSTWTRTVVHMPDPLAAANRAKYDAIHTRTRDRGRAHGKQHADEHGQASPCESRPYASLDRQRVKHQRDHAYANKQKGDDDDVDHHCYALASS
ncbi:protein of unknown function [Cupriavidus taiwanensis]|nr:protein of unknown function [Cupriavidus taiwanensis]